MPACRQVGVYANHYTAPPADKLLWYFIIFNRGLERKNCKSCIEGTIPFVHIIRNHVFKFFKTGGFPLKIKREMC